jgi:SAM-dependent methyltransferase
MTGPATQFDETYTRYQADRSAFRKKVRTIFLRRLLARARGRTIDFGCGVGELLALLPAGSVGYEVNEATVRHCRERGLDVRPYRPDKDRYELDDCPPGEFGTFIVAHVIEHLDRPQDVLRAIARSCSRLGIGRLIVVVPGPRGFRHDSTHATFVDRGFLDRYGLAEIGGYRIVEETYFPIPWPWGGRVFTYNEMMVVYEQ